MELCGHGYLEDLFLAHQKSNPPSEANVAPMEMNELFSSDWNFDFFEDYQIPSPSSHFPNYCYSQEPLLSPPTHHQDQNIFAELHQYPLSIESLARQLLDSPISSPRITSSSYSPCNDAPLFPVQEITLPSCMTMEEGEAAFLHADDFNQALGMRGDCEPELMESPNNQVPAHFEAGPRVGAKNNRDSKKLEGQPSKNLMAERRRRKRLNDRLSMLRSIVPKISKMDRTSILGDTIDYMKELLQKINHLQYHSFGPYHLNIMDIIKDMKPNEMLVRNTPKFDVERRDMETRVEICCAAKPGLLLSTVSKLEALGLDIQECVISCFNDFAMQASCSEEVQQRNLTSTGDIKQALFRNAGYGGRCL
ncbi:transcription factor bHLH61-like [Rhodamnia argentea]|uniref:Transcription factor bHLH61-like n=1 Tax=Rhodamnia argentea TaxID=178133 RepID=A0A8B8PU11_9MYRT|nr:transcription factor bHLH61-like [Rhodamnia argentea]